MALDHMQPEEKVGIGQFVFDFGSMTLTDSDSIVRIPRKSCELLGFLIRNAGQVLSKDAIMDGVWPETFVEESNLSHHIAVLRKALGAESATIVTVPRRGYRFTIPAIESLDFIEVSDQLIGRSAAIESIAALIREGRRFITLTGPGGVGKTSLARAIVERCAARFADGEQFVELATIESAERVLEAIAEHVGIGAVSRSELQRRLFDHFEHRATLFILDNFEHLIAATADLEQFVNNCPRIVIVVTSRTRLGSTAETEFAVPPLQVPEVGDPHPDVAVSPSVVLFLERARWNRPGFELTNENFRDIAEICRDLDGMPLAIELAAPRLKLMSAAAMRERLGERLKLLSSTRGDLPARQRTMRGSVEWSYRLLSEREQRLFAMLGVFSGTFGLAAAESVYEAISPGAPLLDDLETLVDNNLLNAVEMPGGDVRFKFHQHILEFAREIFEESPDYRQARETSATYFLRFSDECEAARRGSGALNDDWSRRIAADADNFQASVDWFFQINSVNAMKLAINLHLWWLGAGRFREIRRMIELSLERFPDAHPTTRGLALKAAAMVAWKQGDYQHSLRRYSECVESADLSGDEELQVIALNGLGTARYLIGEIEPAKEVFSSLLPETLRLGNLNLSSSVIINLTEIARIEGDHPTAVMYGRETLEYARERTDMVMTCGALINLAASMLASGVASESAELYREAKDIADAAGLPAYKSVCLDGLAALAAVAGDRDACRDLAGEASDIRATIGYSLELPDRIFRERFVDRYLESSDNANG